MLRFVLALALISSLSCIHVTEEQEHEVFTTLVNLKGNAGKYLARCNGCWKGYGAYPDSAFVHGTDPSASWAKWTLEYRGNGKYTLKSDNGKYLARCNGCINGGAYSDSAFVHATDPSASWAQWELERNGDKYTLKSDTGKYLARCNGCGPGAYPDSAFVHGTSGQASAQWEITNV